MCLHHGVMCQQIAARLSCLLVGELYLGLWGRPSFYVVCRPREGILYGSTAGSLEVHERAGCACTVCANSERRVGICEDTKYECMDKSGATSGILTESIQ